MPFRLGPMEIGLLLVIVLIIFGVGRLPQVGGAIGKSIKEFRSAQRGDEADLHDNRKSETAVQLKEPQQRQ